MIRKLTYIVRINPWKTFEAVSIADFFLLETNWNSLWLFLHQEKSYFFGVLYI